MNTLRHKRATVLFVDDKKEWLKKVQHLSSLRLGFEEKFGEKYDIQTEQVSKADYRAQAEAIINKYVPDHLLVVAVDIVLDSDNKNDDTGLELARILAENWPTVPILVYSAYGGLKHKTLAVASVLFDGAFDGNILPTSEHGNAVPIDEFEKLLKSANRAKKKAIEKMRYRISRWGVSIPIEVSWSERSPARVSKMERDIIELLAKLRFKDGNVQFLKLESISPGFSGAYIFKVTVDRGEKRTQVLKVNEDPKKLENELAGYHRLKHDTNIAFKRLPSFFDPNEVTKLAYDWWGAISLSYEKGSKPLLEVFSGWSKSDVESFFNDLWDEDGLGKIYKVDSREEEAIGKILDGDIRRGVLETRDELSRYTGLMNSVISSVSNELEELLAVIDDSNSEFLEKKKVLVTHSRLIHGDLNCRNVLVKSGKPTDWVLIDFPHAQPGTLAEDFAKTEIEILGIVMDWASGEDINLDRLRVWLPLVESLSQRLHVHKGNYDQEELKKVSLAIGVTRSRYSKLRGNIGDPQLDYFLHLTKHALKSIQYRDLTMAKRFLLIHYSLKLLKMICG